jgi:hypothetical protein
LAPEKPSAIFFAASLYAGVAHGMSQNLMVPPALPPPPCEAEPPPQAARRGAEAAAAAKPRNPRREKAEEAIEGLVDTVVSFQGPE